MRFMTSSCRQTNTVAAALPSKIPSIRSHGPVPSCVSAHSPSNVPPILGTNMRQVVSTMSPIKVMPLGRCLSGGDVDLVGSFAMYLYTVTRQGGIRNMPRRNNTPRLTRRDIPLRTCRDKRTYRNENEATTAAEKQMLLKPDLELRGYKCTECRYWHLTRQKSA